MRITRQPWGLALMLAAGLILGNTTLRAESRPVVRLDSEVKDGVVRLVAEANGPFEYTTSRPNRSLFVLDLTGVTAAQATAARTVESPLVSGYRVMAYATGTKPVVRIEMRLSADAEPTVEHNTPNELTLMVAGKSAAGVTSATDIENDADGQSGVHVAAANVKTAIEHVRLEENGGDTQVNVTGSEPLTYHVTRLANPDRIVLDFAGTKVSLAEHNIPSNLDPVR